MVKRIILVTGPARSGKSEWAELLAQQSGKPVIYLATSRLDPDDSEWQERIDRHRQRRQASWRTQEVPVALTAALLQGTTSDNPSCLLVDSLGTWVANLLAEDDPSWSAIVEELMESLKGLKQGTVIFVAEETGWGVIPAYPMGRSFRDRLGDVVRRLGAIADPVYLVTGGHAVNLSAIGSVLPPTKTQED
ncbi:bifunctional adenosylcobinamide kinase/adenosylcobinamide-phosphate guanylyltransferase [Laspinema sp. D1]|uniref:Adenosylcobinamide kinase n=1 Tax=Laspinema palackyanum D2a TaxID=2953684 RepID=A0ABT2MNQ1_9CYAN|nr:bifunctional adenosylcobinamide kinase/adenosylcobinamide-phosphate guanylyltransferase [Laspinema sp. D2b]MCT7966372.1 bifunctional adenosylcobinamide kinase/adenosylcobinamide-phosphate guanylyltransferase [Laspinema sp. D2a]